VTFLKIFDYIRELFSNQQLSKINGYTPAYFSFNVEGGRCEECRGEGKITIEMQFVADMHLTCESCKGRRYKDDILEVRYNGKNIDDVLNMTVAEGMEFFENHKNIVNGLRPLQQVGLDYLQLGQPTSTLSGGEAQRLKLAGFLAKGNRNVEHTLFIFDEPTTGLHWNDIHKLLDSFNALIEIGHTILVIEHNLEIIKNADHLIDLGPEGGKFGGEVVFQGTPEELVNSGKTHTARYLKEKL
jgi:excinuclease ABC subunit A